MFDSLINWKSVSLISLGAIPGSYLRFLINKKSSSKYIYGYWKTFGVNTFGTFLLGIFIALHSSPKIYKISDDFFLFLSMGFLASFTTFSGFLYELSRFLERGELRQFTFTLSLSVFIGIVAAILGLLIVNA
tara:strand:+ start:76 stop:471 length:396 start_codon:yes stop_codon:yes gene_type:complete